MNDLPTTGAPGNGLDGTSNSLAVTMLLTMHGRKHAAARWMNMDCILTCPVANINVVVSDKIVGTGHLRGQLIISYMSSAEADQYCRLHGSYDSEVTIYRTDWALVQGTGVRGTGVRENARIM